MFSAVLTAVIERAVSLTAEEAESMGLFWTSEEGLSYVREPGSRRTFPVDSNPAIRNAWQRASHLPAAAGRVDGLDAAIAAEQAAEHGTRHLQVSAVAKAGTVEAARSAVLADGVQDLIEDADFQLLVAPWQHAVGLL
jgi:hypothetical protein